MSNKRVTVKALLRGQWIIMPGDLVKSILGCELRPGEIGQVLKTYYIETPIKDTREVMRESWIDLEIVKTLPRTPACLGLRIALPVQSIHLINGRTFDQFILMANWPGKSGER